MSYIGLINLARPKSTSSDTSDRIVVGIATACSTQKAIIEQLTATVAKIVLNCILAEKRINSTTWVNGFNVAIQYTNCAPDFLNFQSG